MEHDGETKIIDMFYRGVCDDSLLHEAVGMLASHFDSPSACLGEMDQTSGRWMIGSGTVDTAQLARYAEVSAYDPAPRAFSALRICTASTSDRVFSDRERRRSAFLNEYMRPAGLDHSMGTPLYLDARRFALLGVHQAFHRKRFDDGDIASLERLSPHVARTLQLRRTFLDLRRKEETFEALVEQRQTGMIGFCGGRALFVNRAARAIAAAGDGLALDRTGRPILFDRLSAGHLAKLETEVLLGGSGGFVRAARPSGAQSYILLVSRLPRAEGMTADDEIGILFSIYDPSRTTPATDAAISNLLRVPRGPAKVIAALLDGRDLKSYAAEAGISVNTVRCQLKAAFAQTETHSQADLVRLALSALTALECAGAPA